MDLISRQAAIESVTKYCIKHDLRDLLADLEVLPSAEQEQKTGKWIPVSERLPEVHKAVLGFAPRYNNIWAVDISSSGEWMLWVPGISIKYNSDFNGEIVAWMPLPEPMRLENET